jgi:hypothetical protein
MVYGDSAIPFYPLNNQADGKQQQEQQTSHPACASTLHKHPGCLYYIPLLGPPVPETVLLKPA